MRGVDFNLRTALPCGLQFRIPAMIEDKERPVAMTSNAACGLAKSPYCRSQRPGEVLVEAVRSSAALALLS